MNTDMIEDMLGADEARKMFNAGFVMTKHAFEKKALNPAGVLAGIKGAGKAVAGLFGGAAEVGKGVANSIPALMVGGLGIGALGAIGYNSIKDQLTELSPKEKVMAKIDAIYANRAKEIESSKWMERVTGMRDDLRRNYRKMSPQEYNQKYQALVDALEERMA